MTMTPRWYQALAVSNSLEAFRRGENPCVVLPTGAGKSLVIAGVAKAAVERGKRSIVLVDRKELVEQNVAALQSIGLKPGVYAASLNRRDTDAEIIVAQIHSVYRRMGDLQLSGTFDLIMVDEAHGIPPSGEGRFRTFIDDARAANPDVIVWGDTATPYRMTTGKIVGDGQMFDSIAFEVGVKKLIDEGYLSPLLSKSCVNSIDLEGLHTRGGEYKADEVEDRMLPITGNCIDEVIQRAQFRESIIVFASSIAHADSIGVRLDELGEAHAVVNKNTTDEERAEAVRLFRNKEVRFLVNVVVFTVGFDAPNVDCVVLLRATKSKGLYSQMIGRGFRISEGKRDCLVLDFGRNITSHGPIDLLDMEFKSIVCPHCREVFSIDIKECPSCGELIRHEEPEDENESAKQRKAGTSLTDKPSDADILSNDKPAKPNKATHEVHSVQYALHYSPKARLEDAPPTMRLDYYNEHDIRVAQEWFCPEHRDHQWQVKRSREWWNDRTTADYPTTAQEAVDLAQDGALAVPQSIEVTEKGESLPKVVGLEITRKFYQPEPPVEQGTEDEWVFEGSMFNEDGTRKDGKPVGEKPIHERTPSEFWDNEELPF